MIKIIEGSSLNFLFGDKFEFIESGFSTGEENMRFDMERTLNCSEGMALPMFRLYGWQPWSVSLGANQKETDINYVECKKRGFDIVRRPTGGRAVLHGNELTYSVVLPLPEKMTVHDVYREIHIILLKGLKRLKAEGLDFEQSQAQFRDIYKSSGSSMSCFASSARYEIAYQGRKVVGSAQRLFGKTLLQHGSILLGPGHEQLSFCSAVQSQEKQKILYEYILQHSATMEEACGRKIGFQEAAEAVGGEIVDLLIC